MAEQFYIILTSVGKAKIANANILGNKINFVKLKVGDGGGTYYNPTEDQIDIKNKVWEGNINSISIDENNPNWIIIETVIPGDVGGFFVREAGMFDGDNNLIAIGKYPETYKPIASEGSSKDLVIKMILEISNSENVTLKIDPSVVIATKNDIIQLTLKLNNKVDKTDYTRAPGYAVTDVASTNVAYVINTTPSPAAYLDGMQVVIVPTIKCGENPTIKWNTLGVIPIKHLDGSDVVSGDISTSMKYHLIYYKGTFYILNDSQLKVDKVDYARAPGYAVTTGTNTNYTITTTPAPNKYEDGMQITIVPHIICGTNPTLNWNGLGALAIVNQDGSAINAGDIKANMPISLVRVGNFFFMRNGSKYKNTFDKLYGNNLCKYFGANMPTARMNCACSEYDGKIYVVGGCLGYQRLDTMGHYVSTDAFEIFDIKNNSWSIGPSLPHALQCCASCSYNGKIYVFGGEYYELVGNHNQFNKTVYIYDILTNTWSQAHNMNFIMGGDSVDGYYAKPACNLIHDDKIFLIGPSDDMVMSTLNRYCYKIYDIKTDTYTDMAKPINDMPNASYSIYNNKIYIIGVNSLQIYDISTDTWNYIRSDTNPYYYAYYRAACGIYNNKVFLAAGAPESNVGNFYLNKKIIVYDINTCEYLLDGGCMSIPRIGSAYCVYKDKLFVIGGEFETSYSNGESLPFGADISNRIDIIDMNI